MRTSRSILSLLVAAALVAQPFAASARPGGSFRSSGGSRSGSGSVSHFSLSRPAPSGSMTYQSQGSRGSRTSAPVSGAQSITRSQNSTPGPVLNNNAGLGNSVSKSPQLANQPSYGQTRPMAPVAPMPSGHPWSAPSTTPSFAQRHPIVTGMLAGAAGSYLYNHLFSGGATTGTYGGPIGQGSGQGAATYSTAQEDGMGVLGLLVRLAVLIGLGWAVVAFWRGVRGSSSGSAYPGSSGAYAQPSQDGGETAYTVTDDDKKVFVALLQEVNSAWSRGDIHALQMYLSSEMVQYYKEPLDGNTSQGVRNLVENVSDVQVQPLESWREGPVAYATCRMRWTALDYTVNLHGTPADADYVIDGSNTTPTAAEEIWTFARHVDGDWILTAVQQIA